MPKLKLAVGSALAVALLAIGIPSGFAALQSQPAAPVNCPATVNHAVSPTTTKVVTTCIIPKAPGPTVTKTVQVPGPTTTVTATATVTAAPEPPVDPVPEPEPEEPPVVPEPPLEGFPNASNTGAPVETGLAVYDGPMTISSGTVRIDDKRINSMLTVARGATVYIDDSVMDFEAYRLIFNKGTVHITDTTLVGGDLTTIDSEDAEGFTAYRIDVSGGQDGVRLDNGAILKDSYIHDLQVCEGCHYDGVTADGRTGWVVEHNTIINQHEQTSCIWIGDPRYSASSGVLARNFLSGGGYCVYAGPATTDGLKVRDNVFEAGSSTFGPVTKWSSQSQSEWSGNVDTNGKPVLP